MDTLMPCVDMRGIGRVSYMNPTFWGVLGPGFLIQVPNAYPISTVGFGRIVTARNVVCACTCLFLSEHLCIIRFPEAKAINPKP